MNTFLQSLVNILIGIVIGGLVWLVSIPPRGHPVRLSPPPTPGALVVHVAGAVTAPGVYDLPSGARIREAVEAAGGLLPKSDINSLNLAEKLVDGQQVVVPVMITTSTEPHQSSTSGSGLVNINTASSAELQKLPGIGPSISQRIIEYRNQNGAFEDKIDITKVSGIGPSTYEKIKAQITVDH